MSRYYQVHKQTSSNFGNGWNLELFENGKRLGVYHYPLAIGPMQHFEELQSTDLSFITCEAEGRDFARSGALPVCHDMEMWVA